MTFDQEKLEGIIQVVFTPITDDFMHVTKILTFNDSTSIRHIFSELGISTYRIEKNLEYVQDKFEDLCSIAESIQETFFEFKSLFKYHYRDSDIDINILSGRPNLIHFI